MGTGEGSNSKPLPEIPTVFFPSPQLDPTFRRRKRLGNSLSAARPSNPFLPLLPLLRRALPLMSVPLHMGLDDKFDIFSQSSTSIYSPVDEDEEEPVMGEVLELNMELDMSLGLPFSIDEAEKEGAASYPVLADQPQCVLSDTLKNVGGTSPLPRPLPLRHLPPTTTSPKVLLPTVCNTILPFILL